MPIFDLTIPSTKKKVKFRQFTIREEKALVQAQQSDDIATISNSVKEIVSACVTGLDNVDELTLFDIEYIMTRIRAKSVGEIIDLTMPCDADATHKRIPVRINLDTIEVDFPEGHSKQIGLYEDVGVMMKYPTLGDVNNFENVSGFEAILMCLDYIYTNDEMFEAKDQTKEELMEFLEGLTKKQLEKIDDVFFNKMPVFKHEIEYVCVDCGHKHSKIIKGLSNFFT